MASGVIELQIDTVPADPAIGFMRVYPKSDGLYIKDNLGNESKLNAVLNNLSPLTTLGDLIYFDGTNHQRLPIGLDGQVLSVNGSNLPVWSTLQNYKMNSVIMEDWSSNSGAGSLNWDQDISTGGGVSTIVPFPILTDRRFGKVRYRVNTTNNSRAGNDRGAPNISLGADTVFIANANWFSTNFFDPLNTNAFYTGLGTLGSDSTTGNQTDGVYFRLLPTGCFAVCEDGGIQTITDMSFVLLSERWYSFEITYDPFSGDCKFKIYEVPDIGARILRAEEIVTTNVPPSSANIGIFNLLRCNATGTGAASNDVWQDYFYFEMKYENER